MRLFLLLVPVLGCTLTPGPACTDVAVAGLNITVVDDITDAPICDALVFANDQSGHKEPMQANTTVTTCPYSGAYEKPGTYSVSVAANNYQPQIIPNVMVIADTCHVITKNLSIRLKK